MVGLIVTAFTNLKNAPRKTHVFNQSVGFVEALGHKPRRCFCSFLVVLPPAGDFTSVFHFPTYEMGWWCPGWYTLSKQCLAHGSTIGLAHTLCWVLG